MRAPKKCSPSNITDLADIRTILSVTGPQVEDVESNAGSSYFHYLSFVSVPLVVDDDNPHPASKSNKTTVQHLQTTSPTDGVQEKVDDVVLLLVLVRTEAVVQRLSTASQLLLFVL
jgi:hypothetical protein